MAAHQIAQGIAKLGRHGDSTLMHVTPHEVAGLQALAKSQGTSLTINPDTGLPEAFSLGGFFRSLLPTIAGFAASGMTGGALSPMMAGILAGAGTGALTSKDPLTGALMGGLGGYGGANIQGALSAAGTAAPMANQTANIVNEASKSGVDIMGDQASRSMAEQAMKNAAIPQNASWSMGQGGFDPLKNSVAGVSYDLAPSALSQPGVNISGDMFSNALKSGAQTASAAPSFGTTMQNAGTGFTRAISGDTNALNAMRAQIGGAAGPAKDMKLATTFGMPLVGAGLGGLEPSDLYGDPLKPSGKDKYDPYATLNLGGDSGLRLYANGGPVSFADGGESNKELSLDPVGLPGGGLGAMEGAGQYEVTPGGTKLGLFATADQIDAARQADEMAKASRMQGLGLGGLGVSAFQQSMAALKDRPEYAGVARNLEGFASTGRLNTAPTARTAQTGYEQLAALNLNKQYADGGYVSSDMMTPPQLSQDGYGLGRLNAMAQGGMPSYAKGGYLDGPGDGMSDSIPATIEGKQPARLADGEFVVPADVVSHLGNGSTKAGSQRLYGMLDKVRKARTGTKKQGKQINPNKYMPG